MTIPTFSLPAFPSHFLSLQSVSAADRLDCTSPSRRELTPTDPDRLSCTFDSGDVPQDLGNALLDRFGSLYCGFLSEVPKFLVLCGCDVEVLVSLRG
jgi:hypothetical protein